MNRDDLIALAAICAPFLVWMLLIGVPLMVAASGAGCR